jgi:hypothetical protein
MPGDDEKPAPADAGDQALDEKDSGADRPAGNWLKRIFAVLGAIATVGGVITVATQAGHWIHELSGETTCHLSASSQIERSPNLGVSFHQNNQLALMTYANSENLQIPVIDVCLSSAPFEIWFPALSGPQAIVEVCTSTTAAEFRVNPFKIGSQGVPGCLVNGVQVADTPYASGYLPEASPQEPASYSIVGTRAEPASDGDEKYFVSNLYSAPTGKSLTSRTIPMSTQAADLYLIIYTSDNYNVPGSDANIEHFVLRFK